MASRLSLGLDSFVSLTTIPWSGNGFVASYLRSLPEPGPNVFHYLSALHNNLHEAAIARGVKQIIGVYKPTPKNGLVKDLFDQFGFTRTSESTSEIQYVLDVPKEQTLLAPFVRNAMPK